MQFNQPDTLIPDTYNTLDWNRYSYARYNPLRYTDPTGHTVDCGLGDNCEETHLQVFKSNYKWRLEGRWKLEELDTMYGTARDIEIYVDGLTGGMGREWMAVALRNTIITHGENFGEHSETLPTLQGPKIWLGKGWLDDGGWDSKQLFAHELGHVWDIRSWLSNSPRLHANLGGLSALCFFCIPDANVPRWDRRVNTLNGDAYGNSGINEYFAEAFSWTIYGGTTPRGVSALINTYITENVFYMPEW